MFNKLEKILTNKITFICTHGEVLADMKEYYNICEDLYIAQNTKYCSWISFNIVDNKLVYNNISSGMCKNENVIFYLCILIIFIILLSYVIINSL